MRSFAKIVQHSLIRLGGLNCAKLRGQKHGSENNSIEKSNLTCFQKHRRQDVISLESQSKLFLET